MVAKAIADASGLVMEPHGTLTYVRKPDGFALNKTLIATKGPTVDLDAHEARPSELYALLEALGGKGGGTPCERGDAIDLRVRRVSAGFATAAITALELLARLGHEQ